MQRKREFEDYLKSKGYEYNGGTKHDKWTNSLIHHTVIVPRNGSNWSIMIEKRLKKEVENRIKK